MGYDFVRMSGGLDFPGKFRPADDTATDLAREKRSWVEETKGPISTWEEFEKYPWPEVEKIDLWQYEFVSKNLPPGMGMFLCPTSGFLEIPLDHLFGYQNLCFLLYGNPELVKAVFEKTGNIIYRFYQRLLGLPCLYGFFQGDDMGHKPEHLYPQNTSGSCLYPGTKNLALLRIKTI